MYKLQLAILLLLLGMGGIACSSPQQTTNVAGPGDSSGKYTTAFPARNMADKLKEAQRSTVRIISTAYYDTYTFNRPVAKIEDIRTKKLNDIASQKFTSEESTAGTSIILSLKPDGRTLLITCDHAVTSPDTLVSYFPKELAVANTFVQSVSIKRKQSNLIFAPNNFSTFEIIAQNAISDLALITTKLKQDIQKTHNALPFEMGRSENMQPGSFLYILGFPKGFPMITRGLASTRGLRPHRFFITDAVFNPGISGGLIIGSRNNFGNFDWIGMARSATADKEVVLIPTPGVESYQRGAMQPYNGNIFIDRKNRISYGITQAIPIDEIRSFINNNQRPIRRNGFYFKPN